MTARHRVYSTSSRWGPAAKLIGVVAGAAIAATVTVVVVNGQAARACTGHLNLPVTVAPALQPVAQDVANSFNNSAPSAQGQCVQVQVTAEGSAEVADALPGA